MADYRPGDARPDDHEPVALDREDAAAPAIDHDLDARDHGLGGVPPEEVTPLDPDDEGIGNVHPDEIEAVEPADAGLGSVRPDEAAPPDPDDRGLGSTATNG
jgi:hypothetical protein